MCKEQKENYNVNFVIGGQEVVFRANCGQEADKCVFIDKNGERGPICGFNTNGKTVYCGKNAEVKNDF